MNNEIDFKNTWCQATVPNHDKLRLLGFDHEPASGNINYYYIDGSYKIHSVYSKMLIDPDYREIELGHDSKFRFVDTKARQKLALHEEISKLLSRPYCDNCKFSGISEETSEERFGYWGCEDCTRKSIGWEASDELVDCIIKKVQELS